MKLPNWMTRGGRKGLSINRGTNNRTSLILPGASTNWVEQAGDMYLNGAVMAITQFISRAASEAPPVVKQKTRGKDGKPVEKLLDPHPMVDLLNNPNPYVSAARTFNGIVYDQLANGNAYLRKIRNASGRVVELWYTPFQYITPEWEDDGPEFITRYLYSPNGVSQIYLLPSEVVHLPSGMPDPNNLRQDLAPLVSVARELVADNEVSGFQVAILKNRGVPGLIVSPKGEVSLTDSEAAAIKASIEEKVSGENRGRAVVMFSDTNVTVVGFSPNDMDLSAIRAAFESRICAVCGVDPMVIGLSATQSHRTYANYGEAVSTAYYSCVIPWKKGIGAEFNRQLLPDFDDRPGVALEWDWSEVEYLQDDSNAEIERLTKAAGGPILTVDEARAEIDMDPLGGDAATLRAAVSPISLNGPQEPKPPVKEPVKGDRVLRAFWQGYNSREGGM